MLKLFKKKHELTEDEIIEKEVSEEIKDVNPLDIKSIFSLLKSKTDEDIEYESLLTEEEKLAEINEKKEEKKIFIRALAIVGGILILLTTLCIFFVKANQSSMYKITKPLIQEYYKNKFHENIKIASLQAINEKENLILATTKEGNHVIAQNNSLIGDDIKNDIELQVSQEINNNLANLGVVGSSIKLSYKDFYITYNKKLEYINVIPDITLKELKSTNKLTLEYIGIYSNDFDPKTIQYLLKDYSEDSVFYLIKQERGLPTMFYVINKNNCFNIKITGTKEVESGIYTYDLNKEDNKVNQINYTKYAKGEIADYPGYTLDNAFKITTENDYSYQSDTRSTYYLLKFNNYKIDYDSVIQLEENTRSYQEKNIEDYENFATIYFGGNTYMIASSDLLFGTIHKNKSFLCDLGLC